MGEAGLDAMAVYGVEMAASSVVHFACYWGQLSLRGILLELGPENGPVSEISG